MFDQERPGESGGGFGAAVSLQGVSKRFGDGPAVLDGIDLQVRPGEFIALVGPSGCGKSTLLRLIAGLAARTGGSIAIDGREPGAAGPETAFVFQDPTLLPWRRLAANVELPLRLRGAPPPERAQARARALALVGLAGREAAFPRQLSGGQRMRASLARALTLSPRLVLLDEPFGSLDEMTRERLNEELRAIHRVQGWTAFFVTHSVAEAVFLSDRVIVLAQPGRIAADVAIGLPGPRVAATRQDPAYLQAVAALGRQLRA